MTPLRRASRAVLACAALGTALAAPVVLAAPASAHDQLRSSDPAQGATLATAPGAVTLTMSATPLALGTQVQVTGPDGVVSEGEPRIVDSAVTTELADARPAGSYTVDWRVTSSDGHPVSGTLTFTAQQAVGTSGGAQEAEPTSPLTGTAQPSPTQGAPAPPQPSASTAPSPAPEGSVATRSTAIGTVLGVVVVGVVVTVAVFLLRRRRRG